MLENKLRHEVIEWFEYKGSHMHARVRQGESRCFHCDLLVPKQIQIERARCVAKWTLTAMCPLKILQYIEQGQRREMCLDECNGVDKGRTLRIDRIAAIKRGNLYCFDTRSILERFERAF